MLKVRNIKKITRRILRNSASYNLAVSRFIFFLNKYLHVIARSQLAVSAILSFKSPAQFIGKQKRVYTVKGGIGIE